MKALEKDRMPAIRNGQTAWPATSSAILADEPVRRARHRPRYRLRKFARKHWVLLTTLTTFAVLLLLGVSLTTTLLFRALRAEPWRRPTATGRYPPRKLPTSRPTRCWKSTVS